jgi:hypothetical protein
MLYLNTKTRVARNELPWVESRAHLNPEKIPKSALDQYTLNVVREKLLNDYIR